MARKHEPELFPVDYRGLRYWCLLQRRPGAHSLTVILRNVLSRSSPSTPFFPMERGAMFDTHVLWILDPSLHLDDRLEITGFLGTLERDPIDGVLYIAGFIAEQLAIDAGRVVFWGNSGAGFAALMCAIRVPAGRAVAINPSIDTVGYRAFPAVQLIADVFLPGASVQDICDRAPLRTSVVTALRDARARGASPRLVIAQNSQDTFHHQRQFMAFCHAFEVPVRGGVDPRSELLAVVYDSPEAHLAEPPSLTASIATAVFPFLLDRASEQAELARC